MLHTSVCVSVCMHLSSDYFWRRIIERERWKVAMWIKTKKMVNAESKCVSLSVCVHCEAQKKRTTAQFGNQFLSFFLHSFLAFWHSLHPCVLATDGPQCIGRRQTCPPRTQSPLLPLGMHDKEHRAKQLAFPRVSQIPLTAMRSRPKQLPTTLFTVIQFKISRETEKNIY